MMNHARAAPHVAEAPPEPKVVHLHVGTMKSGTSYIQGLLDHYRSALADAGTLIPKNPGPAVREVLGLAGAPTGEPISDTWSALAATIRRWNGTSTILSHEFLALATPNQAGKIANDLELSRVRVVVTARDLARGLPSAWQQTTKNRHSVEWPVFLSALQRDPAQAPRAARMFWRHHDVAGIVRRWTRVVPPDQVTVVVLPPAGAPAEELWLRFCAATALDPVVFRAGPVNRLNASLGYVEAEFLRRLNVRLNTRDRTGPDGREHRPKRGDTLDQPSYRRLVTGVISRRLLRGGGWPHSTPASAPRDVRDWLVLRAQRMVDEVIALGPRVVGDLDDLIPTGEALARAEDSVGQMDEQDLAGGTDRVAHDVAETAVHVAAGLLRILDSESQHNSPSP